MGPSLPGQSGSWCGQLIQVALCGSHSAGMRYVTSTPNHQLPIPNHPNAQLPTTPNARLPTTLNARLPTGSAFKVPAQDRGIGVNASIAEERPVAAHLFDQCGVALRDEDLFSLAGFRDVAAERIGDERMAEKGDAVGARLVLVPDAVWRRDIHPVGDGVRSLHRSPRIDLRLAPFLLLGRMPPDGGRVEEHLRAEQ